MDCQPNDPCYNSACDDCNSLIKPCLEICPVPVYTSSSDCLNPIDDKCVAVTVDDNVCLGFTKPARLNTVLNKILLGFKGFFSTITSTTLQVIPTVGTCGKTVTIELAPSTNLGNGIIIGTDGKPFVRKMNIASGNCITFNKSLVNGVETFTPVIDMICLSALICPICSNAAPTSCTTPNNIIIN